MSRAFDENLLEKLVCPVTRGSLRYDRQAQELVSEAAGVAYPIRDGVAVMLIEEARPLDAHAPLDGRAPLDGQAPLDGKPAQEQG